MRRRFGVGALLAAASAILYGSLNIFARLAYDEGWNVPSLLAFRFVFAGLTVLPLAIFARDASGQRERSWRGMPAAFALGAFGYATTTAFYFPSLKLLPVAVASFLLYLSPVVVVLLAALVLRERVTARVVLALALALVGLGLLASGAFTGALSLPGIALAVASALAFAATTVAGRNAAQRIPWPRLTLGVCAGAMVTYFLFAGATGQLEVPGGSRAMAWAVALGVVGTGIPIALFFAALSHAPATQVSVVSTLEPVSTLILGAVFLAELPGRLGIVGGALIVGAAALIASAAHVPVAPHE